MDPAVISAGAALGGVLLGQVLARSGEYRKWLRAERHRAATELLAIGEALRRHSAARIVACTHQSAGEPDDLLSRAFDPEVHLADLERLDLAQEAVRTVFPRHVTTRARGQPPYPGSEEDRTPGTCSNGTRGRIGGPGPSGTSTWLPTLWA